jgi:hypothetical protein
MKTPVSTITCPNPRCSRQHALFWGLSYAGARFTLAQRFARWPIQKRVI